MIVYHGSFLEIPTPDIRHSRPRVDFGPGFYTTPLFEQASKWCNRFKDKGRDAVVNRYVCNDEIYASRKLLTFLTPIQKNGLTLSCAVEEVTTPLPMKS